MVGPQLGVIMQYFLTMAHRTDGSGNYWSWACYRECQSSQELGYKGRLISGIPHDAEIGDLPPELKSQLKKGLPRWMVGASVTLMPKLVRYAMMPGVVEYDLCASHFVAAVSMAKQLNLPHEHLEEYIQHKDALRVEFAKQTGAPVGDVKQMVTATSLFGSTGGDFMRDFNTDLPEMVKLMQCESLQLRKVLWERCSDARRDMLKSMNCRDVLVSNACHKFMEYERQALDILEAAVLKTGDLAGYCNDAVFVVPFRKPVQVLDVAVAFECKSMPAGAEEFLSWAADWCRRKGLTVDFDKQCNLDSFKDAVNFYGWLWKIVPDLPRGGRPWAWAARAMSDVMPLHVAPDGALEWYLEKSGRWVTADAKRLAKALPFVVAVVSWCALYPQIHRRSWSTTCRRPSSSSSGSHLL